MSITLDSIIKNYMIEKEDSSKHSFQRYLQLLINGMTDLNIDVTGVPKFLEIILNGDLFFEKPCDSLRILGIHFPAGNERWSSFTRGNDLSIATSPERGPGSRLQSTTTISEAPITAFNYTNHWRNGQNTGAYYANTVSNPYVFRENHEFDTIEVSSNSPSIIILEYLPIATQVNGKFQVDAYMLEPLLAWLRYASIRSKRSVSQNEVMMLRRSYTAAKNHLRKRLSSMTMESFLNAARSSSVAIYKF